MKYVRNCDQCRKRKLKCDRISPCGPCRTRNVAHQCLFSGLPGNDIKGQDTVALGHPKLAKFSNKSKAKTDPAEFPLPDEEEVNRLADIYFGEQDRGFTSYVITRAAFDKGRIHADSDPGWRSMVHAICGVGTLFTPKPDPDKFAPHLFAAEDLLDNHCDTDRHPEILHVRICYLLVLGMGPLRGPHMQGRVQKGVFIAHVLSLHLEPDERLPLAEKQDRAVLFCTVVKSDYFSSLGIGRTFTMTRPDAEALPSLFGWMEGGKNILGLDHSLLFSLKMANIARQIVDRERRSRDKWVNITLSLKEELDDMQGRAMNIMSSSSEATSIVADSPKVTLPFNSSVLRMGFCSLRWSLHKPFYRFQGTMYEPKYHDLHVACLESAFEHLHHLATLFSDYIATFAIDSYNPPSPPNHVEMVGVWFPVFLSLRCALFLRRHIDYLDESPTRNEAVTAERKRAADSLKLTREVLVAISKHSVIARDGLLALRESGAVKESMSDTNNKKRKAYLIEGERSTERISQSGTEANQMIETVGQPSQPTTNGRNADPPSSVIDDLLVFQSNDGLDFWDMIAWMEPVTS